MSNVFIIAEAGVNHNGSLELAMKLVDAAVAAGVDAVKFQTFKAEKLVGAGAQKAEYQKRSTGTTESQLEMLKKLELDEDAHHTLMRHCQDKGIEFLSTAFDPDSIEFLQSLGMRKWKIPSGEITNLPYLRKIGSFGRPVILSTGMATLGEAEAALDALIAAGTKRDAITILHCTTEYPAPLDEVNLRAMVTMGQAFGLHYGYSDHTQGIVVPIAASALGASIIEKHFTMDKTMKGPDHKASLEPDELAAMVSGIRAVEMALGDGIKRITVSEALNRPVARKSIVAAARIEKGELFSDENLTTKRPGTGISPMDWDEIIGVQADRSYDPDEAILK